MKRLKILSAGQVLLGCAFAVLSSCEMNSDLVQKQATSTSAVAGKSANAIMGTPITMNRIDLFLHRTEILTGTVTVQITNADGTVVLGSTTVLGSSLARGTSDYSNSFYFPTMNLESNTKYRVYLTRSDKGDVFQNSLSWGAHASYDDIDFYPKGNSSISGPSDFAFVSYSDGYVDQQQLDPQKNYRIGMMRWDFQEFVPSKIWVNH